MILCMGVEKVKVRDLRVGRPWHALILIFQAQYFKYCSECHMIFDVIMVVFIGHTSYE